MIKALLIVLVGCIIGICSINNVAYGSDSTTTIFSSPNPSTLGQSVTFTASVSPNFATGTVQFQDTSAGVTTIIGSSIVSSGTASIQTSSLSVGSHTIVAKYLGDSNNSPSNSNLLTQTVGQASLPNQQAVTQSPFTTKTITIDTVPRIATLVVDNTLYLPTDIPLQFNWQIGSKHTITINDKTVRNGEGSRYIFYTWTDESKDLSRNITVKDNLSLRALFKTQYYLNINSDVGEIKGGGWYDDGQIAQFSISQDKIVDSDNLHRHIFDGWSDGDSKKSIKNSITVDKAITISANWKDQYYLKLTSSVPEIDIPGTGWYNNGDQVPLVADKESTINANSKYQFDHWVQLGANPSTIDRSDSNTAVLTVNGPQTVEASWSKSFFVNVISPYGQTSGSGFYQGNSTANISVSQTEVTISDKQHKVIFNGWSGDYTPAGGSGGSATQGPNAGQSLSILVDRPIILVANWKDQYYLDVLSKQGTTSGSGWYDSGQPAAISVTAPAAPPGVWVKYVFGGWSGDASAKSMDTTVIVNGPKSVTAQWTADSTPTIANAVIMAAVGGIGLFVFTKVRKKGSDKTGQGRILMPPVDGVGMALANEIYPDGQPRMENYQRRDVNQAEYYPRTNGSTREEIKVTGSEQKTMAYQNQATRILLNDFYITIESAKSELANLSSRIESLRSELEQMTLESESAKKEIAAVRRELGFIRGELISQPTLGQANAISQNATLVAAQANIKSEELKRL